ncbi:MAG: hypothetical protein H7Z12_04975 [Rhodospirillaceae bacterium]|nr:hypothetical protein [Rhodospirillales bacterium]
MSTQDNQDTGRPPAPHSTADRAGWIAMGVVASMGLLVLVWAASLTAG